MVPLRDVRLRNSSAFTGKVTKFSLLLPITDERTVASFASILIKC